MKLTNQLTRPLMAGFLLLVLSISCSKENSGNLTPEQEQEAAEISSEADAEAEWVFNGIFDDVMGVNTEVGLGGTGIFGRVAGGQTGGRMDSACFTVHVIRLSTTPFPVRIVIDFGAGCLGRDGHMRKGKIFIHYTGRLMEPGSKATTTFEDFYVDSIKVEGTHVITNTTTSNDTRQFTIVVENAKLTKPSGNYVHWNSRKKITQFEGLLTPLSIDDVFRIEGTANGKARRGNVVVAWRTEILEPLIKRFTCRWITRGIVRIARENISSDSRWVGLLNYGNGLCDNLAVVVINGVERQIYLH